MSGIWSKLLWSVSWWQQYQLLCSRSEILQDCARGVAWESLGHSDWLRCPKHAVFLWLTALWWAVCRATEGRASLAHDCVHGLSRFGQHFHCFSLRNKTRKALGLGSIRVCLKIGSILCWKDWLTSNAWTIFVGWHLSFPDEIPRRLDHFPVFFRWKLYMLWRILNYSTTNWPYHLFCCLRSRFW